MTGKEAVFQARNEQGGSEPDYRDWVRCQIETGRPDGTARVVGMLPKAVLERLGATGARLASPEIILTARRLQHLTRDGKRRTGKAISDRDLLRLPEHLAAPSAVLLDRVNGELLFVFAAEGGASGRGKIVVRLRQMVRVRETARQTRLTNVVVTAGLVPLNSLDNPGSYDLLQGRLSETNE